jgi:hypothetical protein
MLAGMKSEQVAGFVSESVAGFSGIRTMQMTREEFSLLRAGIDWTRVKRNTVKRPSKVG